MRRICEMIAYGAIGAGIAMAIAAFISPAYANDKGLLGMAWQGWATSDWEEVKPENYYNLSTYGSDVRVYEWTAKDGRKCIAAFGEKNTVGLDCDE